MRQPVAIRRPVLPQDVVTLARALYSCPAAARPRRAGRILEGAARALAYARLTGRCHGCWGDGSLDAAARRFPLGPEPFWDDGAFLDCLSLSLDAVAALGADAKAAERRRQITKRRDRWGAPSKSLRGLA